MPLRLLSKIFRSGAARGPAALLALTACLLTGCISSSGPILGDAKALLGDRIQIHRFTPGKSGGRTHAMGLFEWVGGRYIPRSGPRDITDFTVHAYEGRDLIVQIRPVRSGGSTEFGLARRIAEGVYLVIPISEEDADGPTRERFCAKTQNASCRITTPEQLFVFARATAAKEEEGGGIAVIVPAERR
jgi:hypothetical protein